MSTLRRINDGFRYTDRSSMRDQVDLYSPNPGTTTDGSPLPPVLFLAGVWAYIRALRSQEVNTTELVQSESFFDVRIPYIVGVLSSFTVINPTTNKTWYVVNITDPDQRQVELRMLCREINDGVVNQAGIVAPPIVYPQTVPDIDGGSMNPGDPDYQPE